MRRSGAMAPLRMAGRVLGAVRITIAPARINGSASRAPSPEGRRLSLSPSMISTDILSRRLGGSSVNGDSGRNRMAPARSLGRVRSSAADMIAPSENPIATGALAKR